MTQRKSLFLLSSTMLTMAFAMPAIAQDAASAAAAPQSTPPAGGLEDIVVTARREAENLQNIPVAATVLTPATLQNYGVTSIERMSSLAPQLIIGRSGAGNGASIGLRGVSVSNSSASIEQSVATVIDGVYFGSGRALNEGLFDLAQAEVLKGPQSMFYGKNTTAGVISLTTANPTADFSGAVKAGYEFNARQPYVEGNVSIPLTPELGIRLAARYSKQFGALFNNITTEHVDITRDFATGNLNSHIVPKSTSDMPGENQTVMRGTVRYDNLDNFTATGKFTYNDYHTNSAVANTIISYCPPTGVPSDPSAPCGRQFNMSQNALPSDIAATNPLLNKHGGDPYLDYRSFSALGNFEYTGDKFSLNVTPGYIWWRNSFLSDFDHTNNYPLAPLANGSKQGSYTAERTSTKAFSLETRLRSKWDGIFNLMIGGYYQRSRFYFHQETNAPTGFENSAAVDPTTRFVSVRKISHMFGTTYSGFGQAIFDVTPTLNITTGIRYTHEKKDSVFNQPYVTPGAQGTYIQSTIGADQTFNNWSPDATVTWQPSRDLTLYGSYRTGYKSGGYSISGLITRNTTASDPAFAPEKVKGFEAGVKATLMDNQLRINADVFSYKYRNLQVDYLDPTLIQFFTLNAAALRTRGGEMQVEFAPRAVSELRLRGSIGYIDAEYTSFPFAPCLSTQTVAQGCVFGPAPSGSRFSQDLSGERPPQAPKWTASLSADYTVPLANDYEIALSMNTRYSSSYSTNPFVNSYLAAAFNQKKFATIDASFRLNAPEQRWSISLVGKNLTNHFIATTASNVPFTAGSVRSSVLDPRTVAVQAEFHF